MLLLGDETRPIDDWIQYNGGVDIAPETEYISWGAGEVALVMGLDMIVSGLVAEYCDRNGAVPETSFDLCEEALAQYEAMSGGPHNLVSDFCSIIRADGVWEDQEGLPKTPLAVFGARLVCHMADQGVCEFNRCDLPHMLRRGGWLEHET